MRKYSAPHIQVAREQRHVVAWSILHIITVMCLILGGYYGYKYMTMPDNILLADELGNIYCGTSGEIVCRENAENIARKCAVAFLDRSYKHDYWQLCEALFGRSAQKSLREILVRSTAEFDDQKIRQVPEILKVELNMSEQAKGQCLAFVSGMLYRTGIYMNIPYSQKLEFTLGMRLIRSPDEKTFPLRVLRVQYEERSIYDDKVRKEQ